jgi:PAS domain S-box-containing protein
MGSSGAGHAPTAPPHPARRPWFGPVAAAVALVTLLLLTLAAWAVTSAQAEDEAELRFAGETRRIEDAVLVRFDAYRQVLRGGEAYFVAEDGDVSRQEWADYVRKLRLNETYPGIQGVGYSIALRPEEVAAHEAKVRAEGFPNYKVHPPSPLPLRSSIVYLEPFAERNLRAFGFDMYSEPVRRAAMEQARDTGRAALSGKVHLVQENETDVQTGFLLYLPLYRGGATPETVEERRALLQGWVYSPFRSRDFAQGVLGSAPPEVAFDLYDGRGQDPSALLLDRRDVAADAHDAPRFEAQGILTIAGHHWTLHHASTPRFERSVEEPLPWLVLGGGSLLSGLVGILILGLATTQQRALRLAAQVSEDRRRAETRFATIVETAQEGVWTLDREGRTTYANGRLAAILGAPPGALAGQPLVDFFAPEDRPRVAALAALREAGAVAQLEVPLHRPGGEEAWVLLTATPLPEDGGTLLLATDTTARRRAEATEREAYQQRLEIERLKELDATKTRLLNAASHELNTPLTPMKLQGEFLRSGALGDLNPRQRRAIEVVVRNTERLAGLVEDVLDVARLQGGNVRMKRAEVDLTSLVEEAVESHAEAAAAAKVRLQSRIAPGLRVDGDGDRLMQVLFNLLHNALKFTPAGGAVEVEARAAGDEVVVEVVDTGIGIRPADLPRLFQPFSQVHDGQAWNVGGTGLGLYLSRGLVELHGGSIAAESQGPGKGSRFTVRLPRADGQGVLAPQPPGEQPQGEQPPGPAAHPKARRALGPPSST